MLLGAITPPHCVSRLSRLSGPGRRSMHGIDVILITIALLTLCNSQTQYEGRKFQHTKWTSPYLDMNFVASPEEVAHQVSVDPSADGTWRVVGYGIYVKVPADPLAGPVTFSLYNTSSDGSPGSLVQNSQFAVSSFPSGPTHRCDFANTAEPLMSIQEFTLSTPFDLAQSPTSPTSYYISFTNPSTNLVIAQDSSVSAVPYYYRSASSWSVTITDKPLNLYIIAELVRPQTLAPPPSVPSLSGSAFIEGFAGNPPNGYYSNQLSDVAIGFVVDTIAGASVYEITEIGIGIDENFVPDSNSQYVFAIYRDGGYPVLSGPPLTSVTLTSLTSGVQRLPVPPALVEPGRKYWLFFASDAIVHFIIFGASDFAYSIGRKGCASLNFDNEPDFMSLKTVDPPGIALFAVVTTDSTIPLPATTVQTIPPLTFPPSGGTTTQAQTSTATSSSSATASPSATQTSFPTTTDTSPAVTYTPTNTPSPRSYELVIVMNSTWPTCVNNTDIEARIGSLAQLLVLIVEQCYRLTYVSIVSEGPSVELNHLNSVAAKARTLPDVVSAYVIPVTTIDPSATSSTTIEPSGTPPAPGDSTLSSGTSSSSPQPGDTASLSPSAPASSPSSSSTNPASPSATKKGSVPVAAIVIAVIIFSVLVILAVIGLVWYCFRDGCCESARNMYEIDLNELYSSRK